MKKRSLLLSVFAAFGFTTASIAQVPNYVPTNGLVGWWPFNGNANDESGNGNNGTIIGSVTSTTDRNSNSNAAYNFPGSSTSYMNLGAPNILKLQNEITISVWFTMVGGTYNPRLLQFGGCGSDYYYISTTGTNNTSRQVVVGISGLVLDIPTVSATVWNNIIYTASRTTGLAKVYLNGSLASSVQLSPILTPVNYGTDFNIGRMACPANDAWGGKIDDIGIWNRALTQQEISDLYIANTIPCSNDLTISPSSNTQNIGGNATFTATTSDVNPTITWQSDFGQGFQTLSDLGPYSGTNTNALTISNVQLANHNQQIRAISTSGNCVDTSDVAVLTISNTCTSNVTVYDTVTTNVYDTLTTNVYDTLTTNITVFDTVTITTHITIYDTLTTNIYDTTYITVSDTLLTTVTDTLFINTTLSLPAPNNENTILIYPNPASDHITIDNGNFTAMASYSIKITNNAGQEVFLNAINQQQFYVDLSTWTGNGLYFVHLIDSQNNTVTVRKIVLQ
jgi:hypothetical protein